MSALSTPPRTRCCWPSATCSRIPRAPDLLIGYTVQPIMFVLLFVYVFGGAINVPPEFGDYTDFLMPGIIVQTMSFGGFVTAIGLSEDLRKGLIDRFRSLPMARSAVLAGRTISDVVLNLLSIVIMMAVGPAGGLHVRRQPARDPRRRGHPAAVRLPWSWFFATAGLTASSGESAQAIGFVVIFPLTFASSAFVPPESMPAGLQQFAEANPFSTVTDAVRSLWLGTPANSDIWMSVVWSLALIAFFAPIATSRYRKATNR